MIRMTSTTLLSGDIIALHEYRTLYFAIPKVANSTMKAICADLIVHRLDADILAEKWNDRWKPSIFRSPEARRELEQRRILLSRKHLREYSGYWKFCLVRNPWDRLVSCWEQKIRGAKGVKDAHNGVIANLQNCGLWEVDMDFERFVSAVAAIDDSRANAHFRSQFTFITNATGNIVVDYIGRMEAIDEALAHAFRTTGIPPRETPHLLKTDRRPYRDYYNARTRKMVESRYAHDIDSFNYRF